MGEIVVRWGNKLCWGKYSGDLIGEVNSYGEELLQGFFLNYGRPNSVGEENFQEIC